MRKIVTITHRDGENVKVQSDSIEAWLCKCESVNRLLPVERLNGSPIEIDCPQCGRIYIAQKKSGGENVSIHMLEQE